MSSLTLELIAHTNLDYAQGKTIVLPIVNHVHKRIERFVYQQSVKSSSVSLAYIENQPADSRVNLAMADRTFSVPVNSSKLSELRSPIATTLGTSYTSIYKDILATNRTFVDERGRTRPLFWRHDIPSGTTQCELEIVTRGNKHIVDTGFVIDLDVGAVYTNYRNFFDADTGAYRLFYLVCTDAEGAVTHELLNPVPAAKEASWEDIDLDTGKLTDAYPVYSKERSASGYTFYFNQADTWYIKPLGRALIQPRLPIGIDPADPWLLRITDGDFVANVNEAVHRYYVPEFDKQPFIPSKPNVFSPYERLLRVNKNVLFATRDNLNISPSEGLHLGIFVYDVNGVLIKALTTDVDLDGERFGSTDVFYEADKILSWDNATGTIALGLELHRSWDFSATYYYEADDYEYSLVDLNPLTDPSVLDYTFVFYMLPDADTEDRAIHHLKVDGEGFIVETSQGLGLSHPNFQLTNPDGSYNSDTVIGLKYISDVVEDTFITRYTAGFTNNYAYGVLAEVSVLDTSLVEDQLVIDCREEGGIISPEAFEAVVSANPRILQSALGYGEDGQEVPQNAVMVIKAPLTLLEDYGGVLSEEEAVKLLKTYMPSAAHAVIEFEAAASELTGYSQTTATVNLEATWEGPNLDYRLYRRDNPTGQWALIQTVSSPSEGTIVYTDTDVTSGSTYYYEVRIYDGTNEYPAYNSLGVKVR